MNPNYIIQTYIYSHPQTDCFVVSKLFSVARPVGRLKLGLKPAQLYVRLRILPPSRQTTHVCSGSLRHYLVAFVCWHFALAGTRVFDSFEELCIMWVAAVNSFARVIYIYIYIYIYIERERERERLKRLLQIKQVMDENNFSHFQPDEDKKKKQAKNKQTNKQAKKTNKQKHFISPM